MSKMETNSLPINCLKTWVYTGDTEEVMEEELALII